MIPGQAQQFFEAAAAQAGGDAFQIDRGLRFNSADSAYLNRTPSSAGNRRTFTWSGWVKRSGFGAQSDFFSAGNSSDYLRVGGFNSSDQLEMRSDSAVVHVVSTQFFRDPSAWYHIVIAVDTTQSTSSDRVKFYVNGSQITDLSTSSYPSLNRQEAVNDTGEHRVGAFIDKTSPTVFYPFNGYLAEVNFIDGQALAASDFGAYDSDNNWNPKDTSGLTFGTNGFYLKFADNSSNSALGTDSSGNNNTWTVNNLIADVPSDSNGMNVALYTGNGSSQSITGLGFQPDFVWLKCRTSSFPSYLGDVVRGVTKLLKSNGQASEITSSTGITSFDSDGFTLGSGSETNTNGEDFVAWCWKAGGAASSNTDGSLTSSVSANNSYGFSVVAYTGNNTSGATVGHGLSSTPKLVIIKSRDQSGQYWHIYHASLAADEYIYLNC